MMIVAGWLLHCMMIATVLSAGAIAWEVAARWTGRPARWAWAAALAGSVAVPVLLRLVPERMLRDAVPGSMPVLTLDALAVQAADAPARLTASEIGLVVWLLATVAMLAYVGVMLFQLRRARTGWQSAEVDGGRVWVTRGLGPAAVGFRGDVLVPQWAMALDAELRRLLLMHEREHVRAGDPRLLLGALVLLALMPWNPVLWVQVLRLRNAIELDCDARVLRTGVSPRMYGSLLLEVGSRRSTNAFVMATFAEPRLFLEERIRRIARWPQQRRPLRAAALALVALALFVTAASARDPLRAGAHPFLDGDVVSTFTAAIDTPPATPTFTPMTQRPELLNGGEFRELLRTLHPAALREAEIGGRALVSIYIDEKGSVRRALLERGTGYPSLDEAAIAAAQAMRFAPAKNRERVVPVWMQVPIVFNVDNEPVPYEVPDQMSRRKQAAQLAAGASLRNRAEVQAALEASYPPLLKDAGIGGVAIVHLFLNAEGRVTRRMLSSGSGYPSLDEAALGLAEVMRFEPLTKDGAPVEGWVAVPVVFGGPTNLVERRSSTGELAQLEPMRAGAAGEYRVVGVKVEGADTTIRLEHQAPVIAPSGTSAGAQMRQREVKVQGTLAPARLRLQDIAEAPTFTPMTQRPELLNREVVAQTLRTAYPPLLRDAGISGSPTVHFLIDADGTVAKTILSKSSGYAAMDAAAMEVAATMRFSGAKNRDTNVPVWVEIPIVFSAK